MEHRGTTLGELTEDDLLARIFPLLPVDRGILIPAGDDTALLDADGPVLVTTDAMVRGIDWLDDWSTGQDVGGKAVAQNVADIAAMGGICTGLLVTLAADPATPVDWAIALTDGMATAARQVGTSIVGGDLSSAPPGVVMLSVTALGRLAGHPPVLRSGARVGDQIAVTGSLGRSGAGLQLLMDGTPQTDPDLVSHHRCPRPPHEQGPRAADAGATAMIDLSDGLVRDAGRIATASSVLLALDGSLLQRDIAALTDAVGAEVARTCVLTGGEEHSLLACFPPGSVLPVGWRRIGEVRPGSGVTVDGEALTHGGWDHFAG